VPRVSQTEPPGGCLSDLVRRSSSPWSSPWVWHPAWWQGADSGHLPRRMPRPYRTAHATGTWRASSRAR